VRMQSNKRKGVAVCCSVLQYTAAHCNTLQHINKRTRECVRVCARVHGCAYSIVLSHHFADIQGPFADIQGSFTDIQDSFADIQGSFADM